MSDWNVRNTRHYKRRGTQRNSMAFLTSFSCNSIQDARADRHVLFMTCVTKWNSSRLAGERIWIFKLSLTSDIYVVQRYGMLSSWSSRTRKANINICNKKYRWISEPRKFYEDVERDKYGEIRLITHHWQQVHIRPGLFYHNSIDLQNMTRGGGFSVSRWRTGLLKRGKEMFVVLRIASSGKLPHFMSALWKVLARFKSARLKNLLFIIFCYRLPLLLLFGIHFHQGKTRKN